MEMEMGKSKQIADKDICPICGEGHLMPGSEMVSHEYRGHTAMLPLRFVTCDTCTSESAGAEESRANKRAVLAFRKQVDGLLTGTEIRALRERYGLNQKQAARLFGGGPVAFSKYENDDVMQSEAMDKLLRLVLANPSAFWTLVTQAGMTAELAKPAQHGEAVRAKLAKMGLTEADVAEALAWGRLPAATWT
jgi:HTH-type transcriptional regulator / antitoxin MqsA